jgi:hypothetical protein
MRCAQSLFGEDSAVSLDNPLMGSETWRIFKPLPPLLLDFCNRARRGDFSTQSQRLFYH